MSDIEPVYSPDGQTIAFTSFTRGGVICAVYLMDTSGSNMRQLTPWELEAWIPDWSPDGESIALSTRLVYPPNTETSELWLIKADGTGLKQLTRPGTSFDDRPSWSPQGNVIAFERDNATFTGFAIDVITADGSGDSQMFHGSGRVRLTPERGSFAHHGARATT